ncbi:MFS transporter [Rathayibacter toxicus]|uniref:Major facilitator superfamily (MFS) profile domain-containing protein n=1 Tax=Rathayibacter toxicus TaxID=145458 RepID=A0A0C5BF90_9MICO|nr:MFS transporter [Rathayibacter toxicus]AJM76870.1 hypothetical protein TI83_00545 [Rathayibacter toxicus]ALS57364.1 hypothetical protein APU90_05935 [Rathayibacter toxicus]KKM45670.1 hypothetical protein VT73_05770 [Rathayibacter toxicus]PPG24758.1 MFS transporter [Rathayibacter toxicus]PPG48212.1 MFS transporter [Rathayibacter toxicus]
MSGDPLAGESLSTSISIGLRPTAIIALGLLQAIWPLAMDMYLPALPAIGREFGVSNAAVQATVVTAFIGMALGQIVAGPASDRWGRGRILVPALVLFVVASLISAVAPTIEVLVFARFLQGAAASSCAVLAMAISRDVSSGVGMVRLLARMQLVNTVLVVSAPLFGAAVLAIADWRDVFLALAAIGSLAVISTAFAKSSLLVESAAAQEAPSASPRAWIVLGGIVGSALVWGATMMYLTSSAFIYRSLGFAPGGFALLMAGHSVSVLVGVQIGRALSGRGGLTFAIRIGSICVIASSIGFLLLAVFQVQLFAAGALVFTMSFGMISPTLVAVIMSSFHSKAGTLASVLGTANVLMAAILGILAAISLTPQSLALLVVGCAVAAGITINVSLTSLGGTAQASAGKSRS